MESIYTDGTYLKNNPHWHRHESSWKAEQVVKTIRKNNLTPASICEVGCGAGDVLRILSEQLEGDITFAGYDISPQAFELCSKKSKRNLCFHLKDFTEEKDAFFDIVMGLDVIEHVEDYFGFLKKIKNKGRYKLFHIPLHFCVKGAVFMSHIMEDRRKVGHIHCFSKETALAAIEDTGYNVIDYGYISKLGTRRKWNWRSRTLRLFREFFYLINQDVAVRFLGGYSISILAE